MPPPETPPIHQVKPTLLERTQRHPYFAVALIALILLSIGLIVVMQRAAVAGVQSGTTWTSGAAFFGSNRNTTDPRMNPLDLVRQQSPETNLPYVPLPVYESGGEDEFSGDLAELLALLSPKATVISTDPQGTENAYSFIPQGLISITSAVKTRTPTEAALHTYGNEAGTYVQSFESMHTNVAQLLKDQAEDRGNTEKTAAVSRLGQEYAQLGYELSKIEGVPEAIQSAHAAYATTYRILGTNLKKVADAREDEAYLAAIGTYNESADSLTKRFVTLVGVFSANNVTFSSSEPGSVFMFNANLSL